ncbi:hypothetical protein HID58_036884 [Brassica napus]|uniref:Transcription factor GTE4 n=1 Tax=Brassica napus TaxID=3708 RepID=A0ABQ7X906_BRANA|nr:hypothetical protein HID58_091011 [Brassica napus]KAH0913563.1 hypothetical protein HID58_036884 [Brassica napus]
MASEPVNGDGAREKKQSIRVYTRKGKGQRKHSPYFAFDGGDKPENNHATPPETLARESLDPLHEARATAPEARAILDDVNTVVVDENSIKEPPKSLPLEDATNMVVDKKAIEVSSEDEEYEDHLIKETHPENAAAESVPMEEDVDGRIRIHVASKSKQQKEEIRKRLEDQLNVVRGLVKKIEDKEGEIGAYHDSPLTNGGGRILSGFASAGLPREVIRVPRPLNQLSISVLENTQGVNEYVEKEKRTPKANQFYRTSEFLLGDKLPPAESNKKSKSSSKKYGGEAGHGFGAGSKVFKNCSALLERLMKHKHGWVFNAPVDVKGLGLHDYFTIIEHPMDLGTVKSTLTNNMYNSPREFAEDVRLTFHNAMTYNPPGQDVHIMAQVLLQMFEERWAVIESDYNREMRFVTAYEMNLPASTMRSRLGPTMPPPPINVRNSTMDWSSRPADLQHPKPTTTPGRTPTSARTPALKKPKANEPNKRDMTYEEKQKLSGHLQNLPPDKLDAIVQIVNRRNTAVNLKDEEIEVDIDSVDPETLWELDRFVINYKKGLSKKKRKAELAMQARAEAERNGQQQMAPAPVAREFSREGGNTGVIIAVSALSYQLKRHSLRHYRLKWRSRTMRQADQVVQAALPVGPAALLVIRTATALLRHLGQIRPRDYCSRGFGVDKYFISLGRLKRWKIRVRRAFGRLKMR